MHLLFPAAAPRHHDCQPGPHRLDHKGHEFFSGEFSQFVQNMNQNEFGKRPKPLSCPWALTAAGPAATARVNRHQNQNQLRL